MAKWTLVQHSGAGRKPGFRHAVEEAAIDRAGTEQKVRDTGGLIFESYDAASRAEYAENFPPEVIGMYPKVRGTFATLKVGGRKLYIPKQS